MRKTKKRLLSALLIGAMFVTMFPTGAFATTAAPADPAGTTPTEQTNVVQDGANTTPATTETPVTETSDDSDTSTTPVATNARASQNATPEADVATQAENGTVVAKVNGQQYSTLTEAVKNAPGDAIITLVGNVNLSKDFTFTNSVTLNLGGFALNTGSHEINISTGANVTITGAGKINGSAMLFDIYQNATLNISGGTYYTSGNLATVNGALNISGGTFTYGSFPSSDTINITGGTFSSSVYKYVPAEYYKVSADGKTWSYYPDWNTAYSYYSELSGSAKSIGASQGYPAVKITLDDANGNLTTINSYGGTTLTLPTPTNRENYEFAGWSWANKTYAAGQSVMIKRENATFTGQWNGVDGKVHYKNYEASGEQADIDVKFGEAIYFNINGERTSDKVETASYELKDAAVDGYTFLGWTHSLKGGTHLFTARLARNVNLGTITYGGVATKTINNFTAGFDSAESQYFEVSNDVGNSTLTLTSKIDLAVQENPYSEIIVLRDEGNDFVAAFNVSVTVKPGGMAAKFTHEQVTGLVVGESIDNPVTRAPGNATVTYTSNNTGVATVNENGKVTGVAAGDATITATITAANYNTTTISYPVEVVSKTFTVTFDDNYSTSGTKPGAVGVESGKTIANPDTNLTKTGFTLVGWSTERNGEAWNFAEDKVTKNLTLYAIWEPVQYEVGYNKYNGDDKDKSYATVNAAYGSEIKLILNGGKITINVEDKSGSPVVVPIEGDWTVPDPRRAGSEFIGWTVDEDGKTFRAQWKSNVYQLTFDADGGTMDGVTGNKKIFSVKYGDTIIVPTPEKGGYEFTGWYNQDKYYSSSFIAGTDVQYNRTESLSLTAHWEPLTYTVTFKVEGKEDQKTRALYDAKITAKDSGWRLATGQKITGWYTTPNFQEDTKWDFNTRTVTVDTTLYGKVETAKYNVSFDAAGGTIKGDEDNDGKQVFELARGEYFTVPTPEKEGYEFQGWYNEGKWLSNTYKAGAYVAYDRTSDLNFVAKWKEATYTVSLKIGDEEPLVYLNDVVHGKTIEAVNESNEFVSDTIPTGYSFAGWYKDSKYEEAWNFETDTVTKNTTLYAKLDPVSYDFTYKPVDAASPTTIQMKHDTTITVNPNGGVVNIGGEDKTVKDTYIIDGVWELTDAYMENNTFKGWSYDEATKTFTANFEAITYTVTLDANGGKFADDEETATAIADYNGKVTITEEPTLDGYNFTGWYLEDKLTKFDPATNYVTKDTTLYAGWDPITYTVTYYGNGGTYDNGASTAFSETIYEKSGQRFADNRFEREGYDFIGWWDTAAGNPNGANWDENKQINDPRNMTIYAQWAPKDFTITFDANGGTLKNANGESVGKLTDEVAYQGTITLPEAPERDGYTFNGWQIDGVGDLYEAAQTLTLNNAKALTFVASWTAENYYVEYDKYVENGTATREHVTLPRDTKITIEPKGGTYKAESMQDVTVTRNTVLATPEWKDHTFLGWTYTLTKSGKHVFTANWKDGLYTVTYNGNGGTFGDGQTTYTQDLTSSKNQKLDANKFERPGYDFAGWLLVENGKESILDDEKPIKIPRDMTLTAQWTLAAYTVTYDANEGTLQGGAEDSVTYQDTITLQAAPERKGYVFTGWKVKDDPKNTIYKAGEKITYTYTDDLTLVAQWDKEDYTLRYTSNIDPVNASQTFEYGTDITINPDGGTYTYADGTKYDRSFTHEVTGNYTLLAPELEGYRFVGWKYDNQTFKAIWEELSYTVTFNGNGGKTSLGNPTYTQKLSISGQKLDANKFKRDGYTFAGWLLEENGTSTILPDEKSITTPRDMTLTAQWEPNVYTISFDADGGVMNIGGKSYEVWESGIAYDAVVNIPLPEKTGYTFAGWKVNDMVNKGVVPGSSMTYTVVGDLELVAEWTAELRYVDYTKYVKGGEPDVDAYEQFNYGTTVVIDPNGGFYKNSTEKQDVVVDNNLTEIADPVRTGYTFNGWWFHGKGTKANPYTFTASWTENTVTLTLNANGGGFEGDADGLLGLSVPENDRWLEGMYIPEPTRTGYTFAGWYWNQECTGQAFVIGTNSVDADTTLYAKWTADIYDYSFKGYNKDGEPSDQTIKLAHGTTITVDPNGGVYPDDQESEEFPYTVEADDLSLKDPKAPVGKTFNGWIYNPDTHHFEAQWKTAEYTVTLDGNGGVRENNTTSYELEVTHNNVVDLAAYQDLFTRKGYQFIGWTNSEHGAILYAPDDKTTEIAADTTLYAVWAKVVDFGDLEEGTEVKETVQASGNISEVDREKGNFNVRENGSELTIAPKPELTLGEYSELITVTTGVGTEYVIAKVNITMGEVTIALAKDKDFYVVGDTVTVAVKAAKGQNLTLSLDDGNTNGALQQVTELQEDPVSAGYYYATYTVANIPVDRLNLSFSVKSGDNTVASETLAVDLRTVLRVKVTDSDSAISGLTLTLRDNDDTSRSQDFTWNNEEDIYFAYTDKSGWDYVHIETDDGREVDLYHTTMTTPQTIADALMGSYGIVNAEFAFSGYQVIGQLRVNGETVNYPIFTIGGNYGDAIDITKLTTQAEQWVAERYGAANLEDYGTKVTMMPGGEDFVLKTFGDSDVVWEDNTVYVYIDITAGYNVVFKANTQDPVENMPEAAFVEHDGTVEKPATDPTRTGYKFTGWYTDKECTTLYDFETPVTGKVTLYAGWEKETYTVKFNNNYGGLYGEDTAWKSQSVEYQGYATDPGNPTREGYRFIGWSTKAEGGDRWKFDENQVLADTTLYAQWNAIDYTVNFEFHLNEGEYLTNQADFATATGLHYGDKYPAPADPEREGYIFQGWYLDSEYTQPVEEFPMTVTGNATLHAKWAKEITVNLYINLKTEPPEVKQITVAEGDTIPPQDVPTRDGYVFVGWYTNEACTMPWNADTPVTSETLELNKNNEGALYAGWRSLTGNATFFGTTVTETYVRISLKDLDGVTDVPANALPNLTLTATNINGETIVEPVLMTEIKPGDTRWNAVADKTCNDWDEDTYAYYYASYPSISGQAGSFQLSATGYEFD